LMDSSSRVVFLDRVIDSPAYEKNHAVRLREELGCRRLLLESPDERKRGRFEHEED